MQMDFKGSLCTPEVSPAPDGGFLPLCSDSLSGAQRGRYGLSGAVGVLGGRGCVLDVTACPLTPASRSGQQCAVKSVLATLHSVTVSFIFTLC